MEHFSFKVFMQHLDTAIVFLALLSFSEQFSESIVTHSLSVFLRTQFVQILYPHSDNVIVFLALLNF